MFAHLFLRNFMELHLIAHFRFTYMYPEYICVGVHSRRKLYA